MNRDDRARIDALKTEAARRGFAPYKIANIEAQARRDAKLNERRGRPASVGAATPFVARHSLRTAKRGR